MSKRRKPSHWTLVAAVLCMVMYVLVVMGCTGNPHIDVHKTVNVNVGTGSADGLRQVDVTVNYEQLSETGIESALDQLWRDTLNPDVEIPLKP